MSSHEGVDWQLECGQIRQRGAQLLVTGQWADCNFLLGPDKIPVKAHKLILAMASPVFQAMFYGPIAEGNSPIPIPDIEPDIFMKVLQYVYTDDIDLDSYIIGFELYYAAQKYMLPHLQTVCTAYLSGNLVPQNACRIYEFAKLIGDKELETESLEMLKSDTKLALSDNSIEELALDTIIKIFSMNDININNELVLFDAAERYYLAMQKDLKDKPINSFWTNITTIDDYLATHSAKIEENLQYKEDCTKTNDNVASHSANIEENLQNKGDCTKTNGNVATHSANIEENLQNKEDCTKNDAKQHVNSEDVTKAEINLENVANKDDKNDNYSAENNQAEKNREIFVFVGKPVHKLISPIRFLTLTVKELAEYKPKSSLLTSPDILALIMNIASSETYLPLPDGFSTCRERRCYNP